MASPLITIGITCYNAADTIARAIDSACAQDWVNYEIVVVDDCSTDNTSKILRDIEKNTTSFAVYEQIKNQGVASTRNKILKEAKGQFIAFFDDDDISLPNRLSQQYERLTKYEEVFADGAPVLCHTARMQHYLNGNKVIAPTAGCIGGRVAPYGQKMLRRILTGAPCHGGYGAMATCSQMARKTVYEGLGGFDGSFRRSEDTDLTIRHANAGGHFVGIESPLVIQTMTMTSDKSLDQELFSTLQYMDKHRNLFDSPRSYEFHCDWIKAKYDYFKGKKKNLLGCFIKYPILSIKKLFWSLPSFVNNQSFKLFYKDEVSC